MQIHILLFESRVERASIDASKMYNVAKEMNGEDNPFGPYNVISIELEDTERPCCNNMEPDSLDDDFVCPTCGGR